MVHTHGFYVGSNPSCATNYLIAMKIILGELKKLIRASIAESWGAGTLGPSVSAFVDPNEKNDQPDLNLSQDVERLHTGFYAYEQERGVPKPPPIIGPTISGPWVQINASEEEGSSGGEEEEETKEE